MDFLFEKDSGHLTIMSENHFSGLLKLCLKLTDLEVNAKLKASE